MENVTPGYYRNGLRCLSVKKTFFAGSFSVEEQRFNYVAKISKISHFPTSGNNLRELAETFICVLRLEVDMDGPFRPTSSLNCSRTPIEVIGFYSVVTPTGRGIN